MSSISITRSEVNRPWWYRAFRAISAFCYRYWWLVWILFLVYLIFWYILCFRSPFVTCSQNAQINNGIDVISRRLDNCCDCSVVKKVQPPPDTKPCDYDESMSGGKGYTEATHHLGSIPGIVVIDYNMQFIPDQLEVYYDDQLVSTTKKMVSGTGSLSFYYPAQPGKPTYCKIVMSAPKDGTSWGYHIGCPK